MIGTSFVRRSRPKAIGVVGVDDAAIAITVASIIAWAAGAAASIGAVLGLSAAMSVAIATSLVMAGIAAGTKAVDGWISELTADDTSDANWANSFDSREYDKQMTSEQATLDIIEFLKKKHGHAGELAAIKVWARWKVIHEPGPPLTQYGIVDYPDQVREWWEIMEAGGTADGEYAMDFDSRLYESNFTSEQATIDWIKGLQHRQGRRAGGMCGIKVWGRWKAVDEPKILAAQAAAKQSRFMANAMRPMADLTVEPNKLLSSNITQMSSAFTKPTALQQLAASDTSSTALRALVDDSAGSASPVMTTTKSASASVMATPAGGTLLGLPRKVVYIGGGLAALAAAAAVVRATKPRRA